MLHDMVLTGTVKSLKKGLALSTIICNCWTLSVELGYAFILVISIRNFDHAVIVIYFMICLLILLYYNVI